VPAAAVVPPPVDMLGLLLMAGEVVVVTLLRLSADEYATVAQLAALRGQTVEERLREQLGFPSLES
jgi:hypothetical protein